ncbi:hypothetical protein [Aquimarina sp. AU474]|uniref:hypothetical protein n=1 Tax=Aquimarina sp. AU474 TaxID=2108529 RepID=UPI000D699FDF|nr:hypothetical protein [Aquimarina sp. AU474]
MKKRSDFKKLTVLILCFLGMISCEESESDAQIVEAIDLEGFMSTTGNSNTTFTVEDPSKATHPIIHMSFGADVSKEEASIKFDEAIAKYHSKNNNENKGPVFSGPTKPWYYRVITITGKYQDTGSNHCGTDGSVRLDVAFNTDAGEIVKHNMKLDNPGNDREEGAWDYYYLGLNLPYDINWIEVHAALLRLKGTDGWFVKEINLRSTEEDAENYTVLTSRPQLWLDSSEGNLWDSFHTGDHETTNKGGRYDF